MKKYLLTIFVCALLGGAKVKAASWLENAIAGEFFHNYQVGEFGSDAFNTWHIVKNKFTNHPDFEYHEIEDDDFVFPYFVKKGQGHVVDILLQGGMEKKTGHIMDHSFDEYADVVDFQKPQRDRSLNFFAKIENEYKCKTVHCHMLTTIYAGRENIAKQYRGNHANYARVTMENGTMNLFLCEPAEAEGTAPHYAAYQMHFLWNDKPVSVRYIHRGDQRLNSTDCASFSFIYLMYALEGRDLATLSNVDIYNGFKLWIMGAGNFFSTIVILTEKINKEENTTVTVLLDHPAPSETLKIISDMGRDLWDMHNHILSQYNTNACFYEEQIKKMHSVTNVLRMINSDFSNMIMEHIIQKEKEVSHDFNLMRRKIAVEEKKLKSRPISVNGTQFAILRRVIVDVLLVSIQTTYTLCSKIGSFFPFSRA